MRSRLKLLVRLGVPPELRCTFSAAWRLSPSDDECWPLRHRVWRLTTGSFAKQRKAAGQAREDDG
eukprot:762822-Hanusia_phi.AAC.4